MVPSKWKEVLWMNCVLVCVNRILSMFLYCMMVYGVFVAELCVAWKYDKEWQEIWKARKQSISFRAFGVFCVLCSYGILWRKDIASLFLMAVMMGSLLMATVTDYYSCGVHCFVWWIAGAAECIWILVKWQENLRGMDILEVIIFCLLQEILFGRVYGRADCHAFCAGALLLWNFEGRMSSFLIHMVVSFLLLAIVQAFRKNINNKGNLKQPVAFVPYIVCSLCLLLGTI